MDYMTQLPVFHMHAYLVRYETHLCTPKGIKDPINLFIIKM